MAKSFDKLTDSQIDFIHRQHIFFVASAPLSKEGHINISPKGYGDTFAIIDTKTVCYLDLGGSGIETHAHMTEPENGRICICFLSFEDKPLILRLYGKGKSHLYNGPRFDEYRQIFKSNPTNARGIFVIDIDRILESCGFAVPFYEHQGDRGILADYVNRRTQDEYFETRIKRNRQSIDGLKGL